MSEHTKEPWFSDGEYIWRRNPKDLYQNGGGVAGDKPIATAYRGWYGEGEAGYPDEVNARRIVACVNACAGIDTEKLESKNRAGAITTLVEELVAAEKQRNELLAALKEARLFIPEKTNNSTKFRDYVDELIAKVESEK